MTTYSIFLVDDEDTAREGIALALKKDYLVRSFATAEEAVSAMESDQPDLVLLDIGLPGMSGIEALELIKNRYQDTLVIMITAYEDTKTVVSAMKLGAHDYVVKPLQMSGLLVSIRNALETISLRKEVRQMHERYLKENLPCFIGESDLIQDVMDIVKKVAQSPDTSILIQGETGTGKELIARAIHYHSPNFRGPLISVNCAAIPKDLIESELFGYEKGAFTGAAAKGKAGLVEQAAEGTLFLDEVGDLSLEAQAKILRFMENGEYYRVGGAKKHRVLTRVVSATNKDLHRMAEAGEFRRDLYYRFAVVKVEIPSLNQRKDDIIPIAKHFLLEFCGKMNKPLLRIGPETEKALKAHHWTGNVRELKNMIERGVLLAGNNELTPMSLGLERNPQSTSRISRTAGETDFYSLTSEGIDLPGLLEKTERELFRQALVLAGENETRAAQLLNLSRDTFRYRRKKLFRKPA